MSMPMEAISEGPYQSFLDAAKDGSVIVADVFAALQRAEISADQCKEILAAFERARTHKWQRALVTL